MKIDHNKIYMKVMNNDEIHYGYQYKDGLNIDTNEFNDNINQSCCEGRLYITTVENIPLFASCGDHIRLVKIPEDARIIDEEDKLGCDKIILLEKISFDEYFEKWFDKDKFDWGYSFCLCEYCLSYFEKWFDKDKFNWDYSNYLYEYCIDYKHIWEKYIKK